MITKEQILEFMDTVAMRPLSTDELIQQLSISKDNDTAFKKILNDLESEGSLILSRKKRYGLPSQFNLLIGKIKRHPKGFAFLITDNKEEEDLYIHANDLAGAMNMDRVIARIKRPASFDPHTKVKYRAEGEVIRILQRNVQQVLGTFESSKYFGFVIPDDKRFGSDIFIAKEHIGDAKTGMKVMVDILTWPEKSRSAEGRIAQIIGFKNDPGMDILSIIYKHGLPQQFPIDVLDSASRIPESIQPQELQGRQDLRNMLMITIDGDDAKDLDDAVTVEMLENGLFRLGVHIADVGHYVTEDSILDKEAIARATSIYLVDRVIPMLPPRLSNGICSLNAGEDRLTLTCFMDIDQRGVVVAHEICESVIHVKERMTYNNVTKLLAGTDEGLTIRYQHLLPMLTHMAELQGILQKKRIRRGAIEFDFPDSKVILDKKGHPIEIQWRERGLADRIIEEFMLCANETVAQHYFWLEIPFIYRVHEEPDTENVLDVNKFLQAFGYSIKGAGNSVHPKAYQAVIDALVGKKEERTIHSVLLRSMQHARYDVEPLGHFGLSAQYYSHFTSPIRRYPDLAIHRIIKEMLAKGDKLDEKRLAKLSKKMEYYATQSSIKERVAEEAERESVDLKKVEFMKPHEGDIFAGKISGVTAFGFFVQLENSVEGLVHISSLIDDFYHFQQGSYSLLGENTKKTYQIGQSVSVRLIKVNIEERQIDFEILEDKMKDESSQD